MFAKTLPLDLELLFAFTQNVTTSTDYVSSLFIDQLNYVRVLMVHVENGGIHASVRINRLWMVFMLFGVV